MRFHCVVGGSREAREAAARELLDARGRSVVHEAVAASWPFQRHVISTAADDAVRSVWVPDLHRAFPSGQTPGTRLVLTQSTYQLQRWLDWLDLRPDAIVVAHASRDALARCASEAFARRGPWGRINLVDLPGDEDDRAPDDEPRIEELRAAFQALDAGQRLETFANAAARSPGNPALQLAVASARMELQQLERAQQALDIALALAPDWEATWFEYGKLWLRADDLERAAEQFAEAARLMPSFAAALTNLGAALAEIDRAGRGHRRASTGAALRPHRLSDTQQPRRDLSGARTTGGSSRGQPQGDRSRARLRLRLLQPGTRAVPSRALRRSA